MEKELQFVHNELLDLMKEVHELFTENKIKYSLAYGSLIGAIRHKGFIPWDDDIDLMMDRENIDKLLTIIKESKTNFVIEKDLWTHRIRRASVNNQQGYVPTIDIFVIDNVPDKKLARKSKVLRLKILQGMMKHNIGGSKKGSLFYKLCFGVTRFFGRFFSYNHKFKKYHKISQKGNNKPCEKVACFNASYRSLTVWFNKGLMDEVSLWEFEEQSFYITNKYDEYLTRIYGDYMTPPQESERVPQHI